VDTGIEQPIVAHIFLHMWCTHPNISHRAAYCAGHTYTHTSTQLFPSYSITFVLITTQTQSLLADHQKHCSTRAVGTPEQWAMPDPCRHSGGCKSLWDFWERTVI